MSGRNHTQISLLSCPQHPALYHMYLNFFIHGKMIDRKKEAFLAYLGLKKEVCEFSLARS
jgi:hypothetical protein